MEWTRLEVAGRVTALARGHCAGVDADGNAFVVPLRLPHPTGAHVRRAAARLVRGAGGRPGRADLAHRSRRRRAAAPVVGVRRRQHVRAALARRGRRGRGPRPCSTRTRSWCSRPISTEGPGGCVPTRARRRSSAGGRSAADLDHRDRSRPRRSRSRSTSTSRSWSPGRWATRGRRTPGPSAGPTASGAGSTSRRRRTRSARWAPASCGRLTWVAGHLEGRPMIHQVLSLPFRGLLRSAAVDVPPLDARRGCAGRGRPADRPGRRARARSAGLRRRPARGATGCAGTTAPSGRRSPRPRAGSAAPAASGGAVHVLIDGAVWSMPDPT